MKKAIVWILLLAIVIGAASSLRFNVESFSILGMEFSSGYLYEYKDKDSQIRYVYSTVELEVDDTITVNGQKGTVTEVVEEYPVHVFKTISTYVIVFYDDLSDPTYTATTYKTLDEAKEAEPVRTVVEMDKKLVTINHKDPFAENDSTPTDDETTKTPSTTTSPLDGLVTLG